MKAWLFVLLIFIPHPGWSEYRAFLLKISKPSEAGKPQAFRLEKSNLDPEQYPAYYHIEAGETISYIDTWMCWDRTGGMQPVCPSPREPAAAPPAEPTSAAAPPPPSAESPPAPSETTPVLNP